MTQTPEVTKSHQTGAPSSSAGLLSSSKLTFRQQEVFDLLVAYINQHGYPPTLSELADMLGVSSSNAVLLHLRALERKNFIKLCRRVSRGISIVGRKEPVLAVQLLQEMIAEEPGARERAIEFLRLFGDQPLRKVGFYTSNFQRLRLQSWWSDTVKITVWLRKACPETLHRGRSACCCRNRRSRHGLTGPTYRRCGGTDASFA